MTVAPLTKSEHESISAMAAQTLTNCEPGDVASLGINIQFDENPQAMTNEAILIKAAEAVEQFKMVARAYAEDLIAGKMILEAKKNGTPKPDKIDVQLATIKALVAASGIMADARQAAQTVKDMGRKPS